MPERATDVARRRDVGREVSRGHSKGKTLKVQIRGLQVDRIELVQTADRRRTAGISGEYLASEEEGPEV